MRAEDVGPRFAAALKASGKSGATVAKEVGISPETVSRIKQGHTTNVRALLLARIANSVGTTVAYLLGEEIQFSPDDEQELLRHRDWIDSKLSKVDARKEPNAVFIASEVETGAKSHQGDMIADLPGSSLDVPAAFKRRQIHAVLRARGESMIGAGIADDDTLYVIAAPKTPPVGKVIACRLREGIYVKRVATEHGRLLLLSANPRYGPIEVDRRAGEFEMIGVVIGRTGMVK